jgi:hypothetical protein
MCIRYCSTGRCPYGENCQYLHPIDGRDKRRPGSEIEWGTVYCAFHTRDGCWYKTCKYHHPINGRDVRDPTLPGPEYLLTRAINNARSEANGKGADGGGKGAKGGGKGAKGGGKGAKGGRKGTKGSTKGGYDGDNLWNWQVNSNTTDGKGAEGGDKYSQEAANSSAETQNLPIACNTGAVYVPPGQLLMMLPFNVPSSPFYVCNVQPVPVAQVPAAPATEAQVPAAPAIATATAEPAEDSEKTDMPLLAPSV